MISMDERGRNHFGCAVGPISLSSFTRPSFAELMELSCCRV